MKIELIAIKIVQATLSIRSMVESYENLSENSISFGITTVF